MGLRVRGLGFWFVGGVGWGGGACVKGMGCMHIYYIHDYIKYAPRLLDLAVQREEGRARLHAHTHIHTHT